MFRPASGRGQGVSHAPVLATIGLSFGLAAGAVIGAEPAELLPLLAQPTPPGAPEADAAREPADHPRQRPRHPRLRPD